MLATLIMIRIVKDRKRGYIYDTSELSKKRENKNQCLAIFEMLSLCFLFAKNPVGHLIMDISQKALVSSQLQRFWSLRFSYFEKTFRSQRKNSKFKRICCQPTIENDC